jgi:tungstate transport system substrate-binding protein
MPSHSARITLVAAASVVLAATLTPGTSRADDSTTVTVVGTSDVVDSNLVNAVLMPDFEKAYPQYTLKYVSQGTGQAINTAESGAASAVLVHAAPLEASFVRGGYSD